MSTRTATRSQLGEPVAFNSAVSQHRKRAFSLTLRDAAAAQWAVLRIAGGRFVVPIR